MTWKARKRREDVLSRETGCVRKEWGGKLRVAFVYPNAYYAGMSNLGFLSLHARMNARADVLCERAFLSDARESRGAKGAGEDSGTLESGRPLSDFDIVALSLSYENDLLNLPAILSAGGVPPFRTDREASGERYPLVLAGGFAASLNPEPAGTIADAVVIGDGERALEAILDLGAPPREMAGRLREMALVPGVYVPSGYFPEHAAPAPGLSPGSGPLRRLSAGPGFPDRVVREAVPLAEWPPVPVVRAQDTELSDMALVETSRGCPRMCAFCAAAHACPSFREAPLSHVLAATEAERAVGGKVGLIGAAVLDWGPFRAFAREVLAQGGSVSPASVRADLLDDEIAEILGRSGHRTVALAPECGLPAHRARVGKRLSDEVFFGAARRLVRAGIVSFKLYFLVGVPGTSREEEVDGTVAFLRNFRGEALEEARALGRMGTVTAVLSPFVPKPFTPLQWAPMMPENELSARIRGIASAIRPVGNLQATSDTPRSALLQGYLGLSDRRVEKELRRARPGKLSLASRDLSVPVEELLFREKEADAFFPWDVVAGGLPKSVLRARYERIRVG